MTISHSQKENSVVFQIVGKLDTITASSLETYLQEVLTWFPKEPFYGDISKKQ